MITLSDARLKKLKVDLNPFKKMRCNTGMMLETAMETNTAIRSGLYSFVSQRFKKGANIPRLPIAKVNIMYRLRMMGRQ
jgi:hypothetical protein